MDILESDYLHSLLQSQTPAHCLAHKNHHQTQGQPLHRLLAPKRHIHQCWAQEPQLLWNCHLYLFRIKGISEHQRNLIIFEISNLDVSVNVHYQPLPMLSFYKYRGYNIDDYPVSFANYQCEISLPIYYDLTDDQINIVVDVVEAAVNKVLKK